MKLLFFFLCAVPLTTYAQREFIQIDTLSWSIKNLDVTTFRNGDEIRNAKTREEWIEYLTSFIRFLTYNCAINPMRNTFHIATILQVYGLIQPAMKTFV